MKDELVSFKTAKLAKDKGFNLPLSSNNNYFNSSGNVRPYMSFTPASLAYYIDAPTQTLLQRWLREKHNIIVSSNHYMFAVDSENGWYYTIGKSIKTNYINTRWDSYEQALEEGLQEVLNNRIIKT